MPTILLTGGRGFVGTNLANELRNRGHQVWTIDLQHGSDPMDVRADVTYLPQVDRLLAEVRFDCVFHLAAEYGRWNGEYFHDNLWRTNVIGTKNILSLQQRYGFRTVFFSSSEVYGDYDDIMAEDVMERVPIKQLNDYAMTKWVGEMQCLNHATLYGSECVRVRLGNLYGPHEYYNPYRGVIPIMVHRSLHGESFPVHRGHLRSFGYISDTVRALANIVDHFRSGQVYNIGGSEDQLVSMEDLAATVLRVTGADTSLAEFQPPEVQTTLRKVMDFSRARRDLAYETTIDLEEGLHRYVHWLRGAGSNGRAGSHSATVGTAYPERRLRSALG